MKAYHKKLQTQNTVCAIGILVLILLNTVVRVYVPAPGSILPQVSESFYDFYEGFIGGVSTGFGLLLVLNIFLNARAMRNEERLKKQYIKAHDERSRQIWMLSGANAYWFDAFGLLLAAIVAGRFSLIAFACLLGSLVYICIVRAILKIYFCKKI